MSGKKNENTVHEGTIGAGKLQKCIFAQATSL